MITRPNLTLQGEGESNEDVGLLSLLPAWGPGRHPRKPEPHPHCFPLLPAPRSDVIYGYVTAASTPENEPFGYVFYNCSLKSDCPPKTVLLGRPWREWAKTVFLNCWLDSHIHPMGWNDWNKPHGTFQSLGFVF